MDWTSHASQNPSSSTDEPIFPQWIRQVTRLRIVNDHSTMGRITLCNAASLYHKPLHEFLHRYFLSFTWPPKIYKYPPEPTPQSYRQTTSSLPLSTKQPLGTSYFTYLDQLLRLIELRVPPLLTPSSEALTLLPLAQRNQPSIFIIPLLRTAKHQLCYISTCRTKAEHQSSAKHQSSARAQNEAHHQS